MKTVLERGRRTKFLSQAAIAVVIVLMAVSVLSTLAGCTNVAKAVMPSPGESAYQQGLKLSKTNRPAAIRLFSQALQLDPKHMQAAIQLSRMYFQMGMNPEGMATLNKAIQADTTFAPAYFERAIAYARMSDDEAAIKANLDKAIELDPQYFEPLAARGIGYSNTHEWEKAISDLTRAIAVKPQDITQQNNFNLYVHRGSAYFALGKLDEALADFTEAIAISPQDGQSYRNRATVYSFMHKYKEAANDFSKSADIEPNYDLKADIGLNFQALLPQLTDADTKAAVEALLTKLNTRKPFLFSWR